MTQLFKMLLKRGSTAANNQYTGPAGELTIDEETGGIRTHDGTTVGGAPHVTERNFTEVLLRLLSALNPANILLTGGKIHPQNVKFMSGANYGWKTLQPFLAGNVSSPGWSTFRNGIRALEFQNNQSRDVTVQFEIPYDYAPGTPVIPKLHWSTLLATGGNVRWGIEYTVAKGYSQGALSQFAATSILYKTDTVVANSAYNHFVTDPTNGVGIPADQLEPGSIIMVRLFRVGGDALDTLSGSVYFLNLSLSYKAAQFATLNHSPNFYGT